MSTPIVWVIFSVLVLAALALDLGVLNRKAHEPTLREASLWVMAWVSLAALFNGYIIYVYGLTKGLEFTQGYLLEFALSTDNLFVFIIIFSYFRVPRAYQHRVLFWGIVGAVVTRGIFIGVGAAVIRRFDWVLYVLGVFLIYVAIKILLHKNEQIDPSRNLVLRLFRRLARVADDATGPQFLIRRDGKLWATPLFAVLVVIETVDVTFAIDSIPAIFGVTTDILIVLTSNIFAILGLRSLFFVVSGLALKLVYLNYGISLVLAYIGVKIVIQRWVHIPVTLSLGIVFGTLAVAAAASLLVRQRLKK